MITNELVPLVDLYRLLNKPDIKYFKTEVRVKLNKEHINVLEIFYQLNKKNGSTVELEFDFEVVNNLETFNYFKHKMNGVQADVYITLRQNDKKKFYLSSKEFYKPIHNNTNLGELSYYYLIEEDYFHGEDDISKRPQSMAVFDEVLFFIDKIKIMSDSVDTRGNISKAVLFLPDSDDKERVRPFEIFLDIGEELLDLSPESFTLLREVKIDDYEKIMFLKTAIIEILSECKNGKHILFFFENWSKVEKSFINNHEIYLRGISFSKLRHEVHERHLKYYDDVSTSIIDVSLKLALLPTTFSLWLFFVRSEFSAFKNFGFFIALSIMAILFSNVLMSLKSKLNYLKRSLNKQADLFRKKYFESKKDYKKNSDIEKDIDEMEFDISKKIDRGINGVNFGYIVLWLPVLIVFLTSIFFLLFPILKQDFFYT